MEINMTVAGLMNKPKYGNNIIRTGDIMTNAPFTVLNSEMGTIIQLPLPNNLSSNMSAEWQHESVNMFRYQTMHNKKNIQDMLASSSIKDVLTKLDAAGADIINRGSDDIKSIIARSKNSRSKMGGLKVVSNPRNEMLFNGMAFKTYSFDFTLVPYKKKDSDAIKDAIKQIQLASAPSLRGEKMFMEYPETWFIKFMSGSKDGNKYLMKINECCCTGVNVNYTPNGDSSNLHEDNAPLAVELTLDFTEIFIPTKESIEEYHG